MSDVDTLMAAISAGHGTDMHKPAKRDWADERAARLCGMAFGFTEADVAEELRRTRREVLEEAARAVEACGIMSRESRGHADDVDVAASDARENAAAIIREIRATATLGQLRP